MNKKFVFCLKNYYMDDKTKKKSSKKKYKKCELLKHVNELRI